MTPVHPWYLDAPIVIWLLAVIGWAGFGVGIIMHWRTLKGR
jgi:hypothetical protein